MVYSFELIVEDSYNVKFDLPNGHQHSVILLEDSPLNTHPSYDWVKNKFTLMFKKAQSKHKMSIKTSQLNSLYPSSK